MPSAVCVRVSVPSRGSLGKVAVPLNPSQPWTTVDIPALSAVFQRGSAVHHFDWLTCDGLSTLNCSFVSASRKVSPTIP